MRGTWRIRGGGRARRGGRGAWLAVVGLAVVGWSGPSPAAPAPKGDKATPPLTLVGADPFEVRASSTADWSPAAAGTAVPIGSWVRPVSGAELTLTFSDGVSLHLAAGTSVTFAPRAWVPGEAGHHGAKPVHASQFILHAGELVAKVPPVDGSAEPQALLVTASGGSQAADWRGSFRVADTDEGVLATCLDGAALVGSNGRWLTIYGGSGAVMHPRAAPDVHHTLPPAPAWSEADSTPAFTLVQNGALASFVLGWSPVPAATKYRVHVAGDAAMAHVRATLDAGAANHVTTAQLPAGRYYAQVEAAGADGLYGPPSPVRALRVASMTLPPGASFARDGAILMPERTAIVLDDVDGLELALQPVNEWSYRRVAQAAPSAAGLTFLPATARLKLGTEKQLVAFVRDTASQTTIPLTLAQRQLHARVELAPQGARWPESDVTARVALEDPSGRIDVTGQDPKIHVRINVDEVPVTWAKVGTTWSAHIPQAVPPGPWVVDVAVNDAAGNLLGEGFLEVTGPPRPAGTLRPGDDKTEVKIVH